MKFDVKQYTGLRPVELTTSAGASANVQVNPPQAIAAAQVHLGLAGRGGDLTYEHRQDTPSAEWTITHNLGKHPAVAIVDSSGADVEGDIDRSLGVNQLRVTFSGAFSGVAYLN